ncbi:uncharacterized protein LOC141853267 [Brevipalpus obovatus]|uniref:uncharacterized protein LOC141853267 n=1 Tax=Brevipalpus obovatus TaxID=246614 RepID=UPI003D9E0663
MNRSEAISSNKNRPTFISTTLIERVDSPPLDHHQDNHANQDNDSNRDDQYAMDIDIVFPGTCDVDNDGMVIEDITSNTTLNPNKLPILYQFASVQSLLDTRVVEWSDDDRICLLTEGGALVLSHDIAFMDSSSGLYPLKHLIPNPEKPYSLDKIDDLIINGALNLHSKPSTSKQEKESTTTTRPLRPLHLNEGFGNYYLKYQMSSWSPITHHRGCILALLSYDNRLTLWAYTRNDWTTLTDVSRLLNSSLKILGRKTARKNIDEVSKELRIQCMTWSSTFDLDGTESCVLVCGTSSGHCHFFKLEVEENFEISLAGSWSSGLGLLVNLVWFENILILCSANGQVIAFRVPPNCISSISGDGFVTISRVNLWREIDNLPVHHLQCCRLPKDSFQITFVKHRHLIRNIIHEVSIARKCMLVTDDYRTKELSFKSTCTGIVLAGDSKILITSLDRPLIELTHEDGQFREQDHTYSSDEIIKTCTSFGITSSRNQALSCLAQSLARLHDHLVLKEPTRLYIFPNINFTKLTEKIGSLCQLSDRSTKNHPKYLQKYMDYFQALRGYYSQGYCWCPRNLDDVIKKRTKSLTQDDILSLKCLRFAAFCLLNCGNNKLLLEDQINGLKSAIDSLEEMILSISIEAILERANHAGTTSFTERQLLSISNLCKWSGRPINLAQAQNKENLVETCPICRNQIEVTNRKEGLCTNNHRFGRCANSLLLCDASRVKYQMCRICGLHLYSVPYIWPGYYRCLYCS